ncbi:MAG: FAD-binding protein [Deltaproteobacteria bacterium]|nr:FAD-binding protein [Myxococcales bacterium]MDP3220339.1 FAD-binding protein [Deltaproteobacteria bacterium]
MIDEDQLRLGRRRLLQALAASAFACVHGQRPSVVGPATATIGGLCAHRRRLVAFDNIHRAEPLVVWPHSVAELQRFLMNLEPGRRITFRSGGKSIDGQALNDDVVVMLTDRAFTDISEVRMDPTGRIALITVGASATWGDILAATTAAGFVPRAVPSAAGITAGGSLSSHSISRFSPVWHKEGDHVYELKMVLPGGHLRTLRRDARPGTSDHNLFLGVVAGFGFLGAIVEVTYELLRVAPAGAQVQVATHSTLFHPRINGLWVDLLTTLQRRSVDNEIVLRRAVTTASTPPPQPEPEPEPADAAPATPRGRAAQKQPAPADTEPTPPVAATEVQLEERVVTIIPEPASTVYASFWWGAGSEKPEKALLAESRYVYDRDLSPMILYEPDNEVMGEVENLMMGSSWVNRTIQDLATRLFANGTVAVTPIAGFTFFQDANLLVREREYTGPRSVVLQQTFILPDPERGAAFLNDLTATVRGDAELPTLCDVLWLPKDAYPFCLSATAESGGFAITLTYLRPDDSRREKIQRELQALTARCLAHGGRIHLVKSVEVGSQADLEATYGAQFAYFRALKARYDPRGQLVNRFYERVLGPWTPPGAARAAGQAGRPPA